MNICIVSHLLKKYRYIFIYIAFILWVFLLCSESLFAAEEPVLKPEDAEKVVKILNGVITLAAALMWMITSFITMFLYPGWTNGTLFWLQDYLKEIWILISNVVYFIFAFIMIAIAFMNIIGKGEGTWELKQAMPKFIVWVLIVPFSWFFVQFVLSISAILTVGVLTLPYDSFKDKDLFVQALEDQEFANQEICKDVIISFNWDFEWYNVSSLSDEANELDEHIKCREEGEWGWKVTIRELITGQNADGSASAAWAWLQNSVFWIISIYSYGILKVDQLDTISATDLQSVKTIADLIFKIVFDVLFIIVYLLLMVALLLALFVRWIRLWIYMMLSPAFGLLYFFGKWSEGMWETWEKFNIKEFISLALVPVYVSAALAFGLVFILVAAKWITLQNPDEPDTLSAGGFTLTMIWAQWWSESGVESGSVIWKLIVQIFWVVILWISVMAALWASKTTKTIVEPIAAFWKSVWDLAAKAPTYAPIIPTGGWPGTWMSVTGLSAMWSRIEQWIRSEAQTRWSDFANRIMPWDGASGSPSAWIRDIFTRSWISETSWTNQRLEVIRDALDSHGADLSRDRKAREELERRMQGIWVDVELSDVTNFQNIWRQLFQWMQAAWLPTATQGWNNERDIVQYLEWLQNSASPSNGWWTPPPTWTVNNTINISWVWGEIFSTPEQAARAFQNDTRISDVSAVRKKLSDEGIESTVADSIVTAYENLVNATKQGNDDNSV